MRNLLSVPPREKLAADVDANNVAISHPGSVQRNSKWHLEPGPEFRERGFLHLYKGISVPYGRDLVGVTGTNARLKKTVRLMVIPIEKLCGAHIRHF